MRKKYTSTALGVLFLSAALLATACGSPARKEEKPDSQTEIQSEPDEIEPPVADQPAPGFWKNCTPVAGSTNLYRLQNADIADKSYDRTGLLGNRILLIQERILSDTGDQSMNPGEEWDEFISLEYTFDLYDPWTDQLAASLDTAGLTVDYYQLLDCKYLLLGSYTDSRLWIYDQDLNLVKEITDPDYFDNCSKDLVSAGEEGYYYCQTYSGNKLRKIHLEDFTYQELDAPLYGLNFISDTGLFGTNGGVLVNGIDPSTLHNQVGVLGSEARLVFHEDVLERPWINGSVTEDAVIFQADPSAGIWAIHPWSGSSSYFALDHVQKIHSIGQNRFLLQTIDYPEGSAIDYPESSDIDCPEGSDIGYPEGSNIGYQNILCYEIGKGITSSVSLKMNEGEYFDQCLTFLPGADALFLTHTSGEQSSEVLIWKPAEAAGQEDVALQNSSAAEGSGNVALQNSSTAEGSGNVALQNYSTLEEAKKAVADGIANSIDSAHTPEEFSEGFVFTQIEDPENYDWGELTDAYRKSCELEEKYGINIYIGAEMPPRVDIYNCDVQTDNSLTEWALEELEKDLGLYPENFFSQLSYGDMTEVDIYISGHQYGDGDENYVNEPGAFVTTIDNHLMMVLNSEYIASWDYTFHHELSHMIDRRLAFLYMYRDTVFSEEGWAANNPDDFDYLCSYANYDDNDDYQKYPEYFCDSYGTTWATEDRAEIFGNAMNYFINGYDWSGNFRSGTPIQQKLAYYASCIRDGFDTTGWPEETNWESILKH